MHVLTWVESNNSKLEIPGIGADAKFDIEGEVCSVDGSDSTSSTMSLCRADEWLKACLDSHDRCRAICDARRWARCVPSRLVQIGGTVQEPHMRLRETKDLDRSVKYATLSHCWGSNLTCRLLQRNYESAKSSIPRSAFPRAFQHAINLARRWGLEFIWIDSLCIIQDSSADWARESAAMGAIYRNGFCNLAATGFPDGSHGLCVQRDPKQLEPIKIRVPRDARDQNGNLEVGKGDYYLVDFDMWQDGVETAPLNQRGWVVQERALSVRTLHFGSSQLFWECPSLTACEILPNGIPHGMRSSGASKVFIHPNASLTMSWSENDQQWVRPVSPTVASEDDGGWTEVGSDRQRRDAIKFRARMLRSQDCNWGMPAGLNRWVGIIERFSKANLTFASDKLVAISGLATEMSAHMRCDYLAGLWRQDLEHQLLWTVTNSTQLRRRNTTYLAPSWSWASVEGGVSIFRWDMNPKFLDTEFLAKVVEAQVSPASSRNPFGAVSGGWLKIAGPLGVIRLSKQGFSQEAASVPKRRPGSEEEQEVAISWDAEGSDCVNVRSPGFVQIRAGYATTADEGREYFYMPIRIMNESTISSLHVYLRSLLLLPAGTERGVFRRVGMMWAFDRNSTWEESLRGRTFKRLMKPAANVDKRYYTAVTQRGGRSEYCIKII